MTPVSRFPIAAALVLALPCAAAAQGLRYSDMELPGIRINVDSGYVLRMLGAPRSTGRVETADGPLLTWRYEDIEIALDPQGRCWWFSITGPGVATRRGIRVGDSTDVVLRLHGEPSRASDEAQLVYEWRTDVNHSELGVVFLLEAGRVVRIMAGHVITLH